MPGLNYKKWDHFDDSDEEDSSARQQQATASSKKEAPKAAAKAAHATPDDPLSETHSSGRAHGRAAVCATMKDVEARIDSWVRWHLHVGFERLYIFFDDASEAESVRRARAAGGSAVVALMRDSDVLRSAWKRQPSWQGMGQDVDKDVQIRQLLNAQLAMELARSAGLSWLLHMCAPACERCARAPSLWRLQRYAGVPASRVHALSHQPRFAASHFLTISLSATPLTPLTPLRLSQ